MSNKSGKMAALFTLTLTLYFVLTNLSNTAYAQDSQKSKEQTVNPVKQPKGSIKNPIIWADVPDVDVIRRDNVYYMTSTSMHMMPGVPVMRSTDLANWRIVSYVYDTLEDNDAHSLTNKKHVYGRGSWATSLRYHKGAYYVCFASNDMGKTYIYKTKNIEKGPWERSVFAGVYHDPSLLFDDDGRIFIIFGHGTIGVRELNKDATAFLADGVSRTIISNQGDNYVNSEGSHAYKIDGYYYIFLIQWPKSGNSRRIEWCYRSRNLSEGWEGKIVLDDDLGYRNKGVAQGGVFNTPQGEWYAMLFQDHDAVGRIPVLVPVTWSDHWPIFGVETKVPAQINVSWPLAKGSPLVISDEFNQKASPLALNWQWNHNPDNSLWSLKERPGCLRLTTGSVVPHVIQARNTLTQRTEGPMCSGEILMLTDKMKPGDYAGLAAFQSRYGLIGVKVSEDGKKYLFMGTGNGGKLNEAATVIIEQNEVYLKIAFDFTNSKDKANFFYSLDGKEWAKLGGELKMVYTLDHFMGYRIGLFNYATLTPGGYVDFDYFRYKRGDSVQ